MPWRTGKEAKVITSGGIVRKYFLEELRFYLLLFSWLTYTFPHFVNILMSCKSHLSRNWDTKKDKTDIATPLWNLHSCHWDKKEKKKSKYAPINKWIKNYKGNELVINFM